MLNSRYCIEKLSRLSRKRGVRKTDKNFGAILNTLLQLNLLRIEKWLQQSYAERNELPKFRNRIVFDDCTQKFHKFEIK